jgi:hypothetical protein
MSYENFVRVKVVTPVTNVATSFAILDAVAPQKLPPTDGGYLVLCDSPGNPSWIEVIKYTSRSGLGISGVTRGQEGTTAVAWTGNVYAFQALMASEANLIQSELAGKQDEIAAGTTSQFWRGDKTWVDFATTVRATVLTGLSLATGTAITAADTVLSGLGKLQKQISDAATNLAANVRAVVLTGYVAGSNTALAATDTVLAAFGKVQGQLNAKANAANAALTGVPTAPTAALGTNTLQISSTAFVQQEIANLINSAPGALDTLDELAAAMGDDPNFAATMTTALAGKEPSIAADLVSKFYSGTKTWRDLSTDVRAVVLTGLSVASGSAVVAGDSILVALGKLQKQCTDRLLLSGGTMTGSLNEAPIVTLASAATVNINAAAANTISVTGTTTITSLGVGASGAKNRLIFTGALTLTHNATSLILPGGANITTAAGDAMDVVCVSTNNWRCVNYTPADGQPPRVVDIAHGGTGATTQAAAQTALGASQSPVAANSLVQRDAAGSIATRSIELGIQGTANTAFMDFHSGAVNVDYDARIATTGGNGANGGGNLSYEAASHTFSGSMVSNGTLNGLNGVFDNGQRCWGPNNNPTNVWMKNTGTLTAVNTYNAMAAAPYENFTAANQVYNSPIELREAGMVGSGGFGPLHIFNAPGITFHWGSQIVSKLMMNTAGSLCWGNPNSQYARFSQDGNIYGDNWGGYLSTFLANYYMQIGNIMTTYAGSAVFAGVGSYCWLRNNSGAFIGGNVGVASGNLAYSDSTSADYGIPLGGSGTWRSMTAVAIGASGLFLRIA